VRVLETSEACRRAQSKIFFSRCPHLLCDRGRIHSYSDRRPAAASNERPRGSTGKCEWYASKVEFLGYIILADGVSIVEDKMQTLLEWTPPTNVKAVQSFLGFANFYGRFIEGFSKVCKPLIDLTKKSTRWQWTEESQNAFEMLKRWFTFATILRHFDPTLSTVMETDTSDFAIGAVLSQQVEGRLHPVALHSRKIDKVLEINYEIHNKEMLAVVSGFKEWRRYLEGATRIQIIVYTDHKNLEYFSTTKVLN
jgi:hypothetical protein